MMHYIKQDDYRNFYCIASECPASCCKGWQIVIDDDSLEKYAGMKGDFGNRVKNSIDWVEGTFLQYDRRCAMLRDDELCDLQRECGEDALCDTCRRYPRHIEEFEDVREFSLSLSCPEVARILVNKKEKMTFVEWDDDTLDDFEDFDYLLYSKLVYAREKLFDIVQNRENSIIDRCRCVLDLARRLQDCVDEDRIFDMDEVVDESLLGKGAFSSEDLRKNFSVLYELETLNEEWKAVLDQAAGYLEENDSDLLFVDASVETALEQILMFFLYTYFCGAVYDDMIYSKAALSVYCTLFIYIIYKSQKRKGHGDLIKCAYSYAREVEHSDINLNTMEDWWTYGRENKKTDTDS